MRRLLFLFVVGSLLLIGFLMYTVGIPAQSYTSSTSSGSQVTQVDTSAYPDITLFVGVTDDAGDPVAGLNVDDFDITEDNQPVTITDFAAGGASSIDTVLVIDRSGSMDESGKMEGAREAARAFVEQMRPGDRTALIAFDSRTDVLQPFTSDQRTLLNAIDRLRPDGGTAFYDSVIAGVDTLSMSEGRRALLVLTDGQDCREVNDCPAEYGSRDSLEQAISYAVDQEQTAYVIGLGDRGRSDEEGIDEEVLTRIAGETSGEYFYAPRADELAALYTQLAGNIQQEYRMTYTSPRPFYDGTRRDIAVNVNDVAAVGSGYVEPHMIYVRSTPIVGVLLLLPILGALLLPIMMRRRETPTEAPIPASSIDSSKTVIEVPSVVVITPDLPHCHQCDAELIVPNARFCNICGAPQTAVLPEHRTFCDQCGRPMRAGAKFCSSCGAQAVTPQLLADK